MLQLLRLLHYHAVPDHDKARVAKVGRVQSAAHAVHTEDAGCAAAVTPGVQPQSFLEASGENGSRFLESCLPSSCDLCTAVHQGFGEAGSVNAFSLPTALAVSHTCKQAHNGSAVDKQNRCTAIHLLWGVPYHTSNAIVEVQEVHSLSFTATVQYNEMSVVSIHPAL